MSTIANFCKLFSPPPLRFSSFSSSRAPLLCRSSLRFGVLPALSGRQRKPVAVCAAMGTAAADTMIMDPVQKRLMFEDECILVDENDAVVGHDSKYNCQLSIYVTKNISLALTQKSMALTVHFCMWTLLLFRANYMEAKPLVSRMVPLHYPALYPESIAWDDGLGLFISGSIALGSLFSITENGTVDEFIRDADYSGIAATVGVTIDAPRQRVLTVINNVFEHPSAFHGLACYNLNTKARLFLTKFDKHACPNDVTVDPISGYAYVTDSAHDLIFKVSPSGESSEFVKDTLFTSQPIVAVDPPAVRSGLNGITFAEDYLLVVQTKSGKLFKVTLHDSLVHVVDMEKPLVAADGIGMRQDGLLVVVSSDVLWLVKSRDHWNSAFIVQEVPLDRSFNATSVALRGPKGATIVHAHFQDLFTVVEKGMEGLPGGEFRREFFLQEVQLVGDPDNNPLWLILIGVIFLVVFGVYKFQMWWLFKKYNRLVKRD